MKVAILGATRGMGQALARLMAERGDRLFLLGCPQEDLEQCASDLEARAGQGKVEFAVCDLEDPASFSGALDAATASLGGLNTVVVTAAVFATQEALEADINLTEKLLRINFTNTVIFCERARQRLLAAGGGTLCVFSSVAGDRGRKPVALYGAGKAGLSHYLESLGG